MNNKQRRFADEYLIDCNATQAAIRSKYHPKTGWKLMNNDMIKEYIVKELEKMHNEKIANAEEVMMYLTSVLRGETYAEIVVVEGIGDGCSEAKTMLKAPNEKERLKAAELLGKRFGLYKESVSIKGNVPIVISGEDKLE